MHKLFLNFILIIATLQLSYADEPSSTPGDSATPPPTAIIEPTVDPFIAKLIASSNCDPALKSICTYTITDPIIFLEYLSKCNLLIKWNIIYFPKPDQKVSITASPTTFCSLELVTSGSNKTSVCPLTETDVKNMASPAAIESLEHFKETPNATMPAAIMETIFKPIDDCLKKDVPVEIRPFLHPNTTKPVMLPPDFGSKQPVKNMQ